jgi:hypothetical protein
MHSYYSDSKLYMNLFTQEINRRYGNAHSSLQLMNEGRTRNTSDSVGRDIVAVSVNPGAVCSDIWRHVPFRGVFDAIASSVFLHVNEGSASSVFAACIPLEKIREYQAASTQTSSSQRAYIMQRWSYPFLDSWWSWHARRFQFVMHPDIPYVVPYSTPLPLLGLEMVGRFAGPRFSGVSLPSVEYSKAVPPRKSLSADLWSFSEALCRDKLCEEGEAINSLGFLYS